MVLVWQPNSDSVGTGNLFIDGWGFYGKTSQYYDLIGKKSISSEKVIDYVIFT